METWMVILGLFSLALVWSFIEWVKGVFSNSKKYIEYNQRRENFEKEVKEHNLKVDRERHEWKIRVERWNTEKEKNKVIIKNNNILSEKNSDEWKKIEEEVSNFEIKKEEDILNFEKEKIKIIWRGRMEYEREIDIKNKRFLQKEKEDLDNELNKKIVELNKNKKDFLKREKKEIEKINKQKIMNFPWLALAYSNYFDLEDERMENILLSKNNPAIKASEELSKIRKEKKELLKNNKILEYTNNYFIKLFPWLEDLVAENEEEDIPVRVYNREYVENEDDDKKFLTQEEYKELPSVEKNQLALDRYLQSRIHSKWAIGRDYEMYTGYLYEQKGYEVTYTGIIEGFDDLGRDVIAKKDEEVLIIQCKRWAQWKEMKEKHIFQLFGTTMEYWVQNMTNNNTPKTFEEFSKFLNEDKIRPIFFTSTSLSDRAREMAETLSVEVIENEPIREFPRIKCNINGENKIYHLPMDQQYDRTIIGNRNGEFMAWTVKEAEDAGFRRAFRHRF